MDARDDVSTACGVDRLGAHHRLHATLCGVLEAVEEAHSAGNPAERTDAVDSDSCGADYGLGTDPKLGRDAGSTFGTVDEVVMKGDEWVLMGVACVCVFYFFVLLEEGWHVEGVDDEVLEPICGL